jgi:hypothetical protein
MTYRNGNRNARNIYRVGPGGEQHIGCAFTEDDGRLIVEALNGQAGPNLHIEARDLTAEQVAQFKAALRMGLLGAWPPVEPHADSCTCPVPYRSSTAPDPWCPVHQGRRARGPKPPPVGEGCICDGSGRTCPRHGAVI